MAAQFIGPMPLIQFLKDFVPQAPEPFSSTSNVFEDVLEGPNRPGDFEDRFIRAVERTKLCPNVQFFNTTDGPDTNLFYRTKVDISGHRHPSPESSPASAIALPSLESSNSERTSLRGSVDWTIMEIGIELKDEDEDPFQDPPPGLSLQARKDHIFEKDTQAAHTIRGQMIAYAASHQTAQFRSFCFSVLLLKGEARLVRWDRAGAIVTEKFNYTNCADNLVEFLWRFEIQLASQRLPGGTRGNVHKVTVHDSKDDQDHHFLVSSATDWTLAATGRSTRGWVALDLKTGQRAWLKDSWRIDMADMEKEVDIYRDLNKLRVRNVPIMLQGGDVAGQSTVTGDYVNEPWCCGTHDILKHQHCRLALDVIGRKLQDFKNSEELSSAVNDALIGHYDAYRLAKVLHRDVAETS
ncbi:hypothetical protein EWM64_g10183 [Hericium alpestre]|uniref:Fungal-type protein kinase domain-containing protein n=1 Tax=Hericium alpestre TaxID=135208 RepID=A0A4Y9ZK66_9AGAM|nr:hypothetical protein EWM64_g10183 [Hericium alpestre]